MIEFPSPILSVASDVVSELEGEDAVYGLWTLFTKCKQSLKDGRRLENISWRLWYREMSNPHCSPPQSPASTSPPLSHSHAYSPITPNSEYRPGGNLTDSSRDGLLPDPRAHAAHSWHGQGLAPSATHASRRLSTASMPARPHPKPAHRAGRIITEILPDTFVVPARSPQSASTKSAIAPATAPATPTIGPNAPQTTSLPQWPVLSVPSHTTSPSTSLAFPSVVVVNPTPHPTPPATPQALRPISGAPAFMSHATHLLPPPVRRPLCAPRQAPEASALLSDAQREAPVVVCAAGTVTAIVAAQPLPKPSGAAPPPPASPSSSPASPKTADDTLTSSDRRFFLPPSESPDERSPDADSPPPLASTSRLSDTHSPSSEASSQMKTNAGHAAGRRAAPLGKARAKKSRETVKHAPVRPMAARTQTQRQPVAAQKKSAAEPKKAAFNIGSTSSNGSRGTSATGHTGRDGKHSQESPRVRPASPAKNGRTHTPSTHAATHVKTNGGVGHAGRRGIVVSTDSDFETTESDDDSEWASEESPDEQELARQREETRLREAAEEAKRQRDMFAKVPKRSYTDLSRTRSGLLSQLLNPDPSVLPLGHSVLTSFSSQDMTQLSRSGRRSGPPRLPTSKSTVSMPQAAQVTAQVPSTTTASGYRPKGRPQGEDVEYDSDSGDETGDNGIQVPRSLAQQKLAALADPNRRRFSDRGPPPAQEPPARPLHAVATAPIALGYPYNLPAPAAPMTPRTTRRQMLATELSESLRRNLLWERQVSKINMTGGARRGGLLGGGLRPLTAVTKEVPVSSNGSTDHGSGTGKTGADAERDDRKRAAMARNRSWADDYHTSGW